MGMAFDQKEIFSFFDYRFGLHFAKEKTYLF